MLLFDEAGDSRDDSELGIASLAAEMLLFAIVS
jgi:hypothetical protein